MNMLPLIQVDAFADRPFTGNPAAVMPLYDWLPDETLQAIALENNLSETAFTVPDASGEADFELRWFTPGLEIKLCGHATLASAHVLLCDRDQIRFRTRSAGILEVTREGDPGSGSGAGAYSMSLPAYPPVPQPLPHLVAGLGCAAVETLWHGGRYALIVLENEAQVRALDPDFRVLIDDGDTMTIATAPGETTDVVSRVFVPGAGVDEDPVTGSAHSVLVPYWASRLGRRDAMTFYQASKRGGHLTGRLAGDRVILGGKCVTVLEGLMTI